MKLVVERGTQVAEGHLIFRVEEDSFDFEPRPPGCVTSLVVDYLELEINEENQIVCVAGYCPRVAWRPTLASPPRYERAALRVMPDTPFIPGISVRLTDIEKPWPVGINTAGWVCVGDANADSRAVEFAPGCVVVLEDGDKLSALWLHPRSLPSAI